MLIWKAEFDLQEYLSESGFHNQRAPSCSITDCPDQDQEMSTAAATKRRRKLKATVSFGPRSRSTSGLDCCLKASFAGLLILLKMPPTAAGGENRCDLPRNARQRRFTQLQRQRSVTTTKLNQLEAASLWM
ncbi:hypothetical protein HPB52_013846 [Rhipicephalus sanguineus]|uniref:Uncharacterized protein n=1 Tax=Rhipicephalus sanguineus TaxID=34632 RepID=A0A9D4T406_RHISA|nr:hypothetical protein HPB52_013846 [Rhipicephalus sanguineus]